MDWAPIFDADSFYIRIHDICIIRFEYNVLNTHRDTHTHRKRKAEEKKRVDNAIDLNIESSIIQWN